MKNRVIVIGGSSDPTEQKAIEAMVESILKSEHIVFEGKRSGKTFASQYVSRVMEVINSIPTHVALIVQDTEGYVNVTGVGKIHIQNWIDKEMQQQKVSFLGVVGTVKPSPFEQYKADFPQWLKTLESQHQARTQERKETAFQKRFHAAGYQDHTGKVVRETRIYDRVTNESYSKEEFDALYFKIEKLAKQYSGDVNLDDITDEGLDFFIEENRKAGYIRLNGAEIQSGQSRVNQAERLITLLPTDHECRNTWLLNYGVSMEAQRLRNHRGVDFDPYTRSAKTSK